MPLQNAPYKKRGKIPFGVQNGTYGLTAEEKMRRRWREWSKAGTLSNGSGVPALAAAAGEPSYQVCDMLFRLGNSLPAVLYLHSCDRVVKASHRKELTQFSMQSRAEAVRDNSRQALLYRAHFVSAVTAQCSGRVSKAQLVGNS